MKSSHWLWLIVLIFIVKGLFTIFIIPPWEAPDEPGHVAYVAYLLHEHKLPSATAPFIPQSINDSFQRSRTLFNNTHTHLFLSNLFDIRDRNYSPVSANVASHPPLYYLYLTPFYELTQSLGSVGVFYFLRMGSLLLGVISLLLTYSLVKKIFQNDFVSLFATFVASMTPTFTFISSIVNNDIMVVSFFLASVYLLYDLYKEKDISNISLLLISFVIGLSPLAKPQLLILLPVYGVLLVRYFKKSVKNVLGLFTISLVPTVIWSGYKYIHEGTAFVQYGVQHIQKTPLSVWSYPLAFILGKQPIGIFMSFWGFFGWLDVPLPKWIYLFYASLFIIVLWCWRKYRISHPSFRFIILLIGLYTAAILAFDAQYYVLSHTFAIQGRYLTPILPLFALIFAAVIFQLPIRLKNFIVLFAITGFILGQILMFSTIINYYY